jgi:hypothetical protein
MGKLDASLNISTGQATAWAVKSGQNAPENTSCACVFEWGFLPDSARAEKNCSKLLFIHNRYLQSSASCQTASVHQTYPCSPARTRSCVPRARSGVSRLGRGTPFKIRPRYSRTPCPTELRCRAHSSTRGIEEHPSWWQACNPIALTPSWRSQTQPENHAFP